MANDMTLIMNDPDTSKVPQTRAVFIGDSIMYGVGDTANLGGWPARLLRSQKMLDVSFTLYNLGVRSDTTEEIANRWLSESEARLPDSIPSIFVFCFGINDATRVNDELRVPLERSLENARKIMSEAKNRSRVLWISPTPIKDSSQPTTTSLGSIQAKSNSVTAAYNQGYKSLAEELSIDYLDLFSYFIGHETWEDLLFDGVHPNASGYDAIASQVEKWHAWQDALKK